MSEFLFEGMDPIEAEEFLERCAAQLARLIRQGVQFGGSDVMAAIEPDWTYEPRSLGPLIALAEKNGQIYRTGRFREVPRRRGIERLWRSESNRQSDEPVPPVPPAREQR